MSSRWRLALAAWPWLLAVVVLYPVLAPGYVLSYDMVFVPDLALRSDFFGVGSALPRAVPSDAVVAVLDEAVRGDVLQKLILLASLGLAGTGVQRLLPQHSPVAALASASLYVWNPFVAERLVIGHWPLLLAYAALPWIVRAALRWREVGAGASLAGWLALSSLSAAGGVIGGVAAVAFGATLRPGGRLRTAGLVLLVLAMNAPWIVAGAVHAADAGTDANGAVLFAARSEAGLPVLATLLTMGGIWNAEVVPVTRTGVLAWASLALLAVAALGLRPLVAGCRRRDVLVAAVTGAGALLLGVVGALLPGALGHVVEALPGAGLLRDGSRFLPPLCLLLAVLFGMGAARAAAALPDRTGRVALAAGAVLAPVALLPDLAAGVAGRLEPVGFPADYARAAAVLTDARADGEVLVLPFAAYRAPAWNDGRKVLDPLPRYQPRNYLADDDLRVSARTVQGEDPRAAQVQELLRNPPAGSLADALRRLGVRFVVTDRAAAGADVPELTAGGVGRPLVVSSSITVEQLDGPVAVRTPRRTTVVALALAWTCPLVAGVSLVTLTRRRRTKASTAE